MAYFPGIDFGLLFSLLLALKVSTCFSEMSPDMCMKAEFFTTHCFL
jgi:hypothetical protein